MNQHIVILDTNKQRKSAQSYRWFKKDHSQIRFHKQAGRRESLQFIGTFLFNIESRTVN